MQPRQAPASEALSTALSGILLPFTKPEPTPTVAPEGGGGGKGAGRVAELVAS